MSNDELKFNPLSDEDIVRIQEELDSERDRQDGIKKERAKLKREARPENVLNVVKGMQAQIKDITQVLQMHSDAIGRIIKLLEDKK